MLTRVLWPGRYLAAFRWCWGPVRHGLDRIQGLHGWSHPIDGTITSAIPALRVPHLFYQLSVCHILCYHSGVPYEELEEQMLHGLVQLFNNLHAWISDSHECYSRISDTINGWLQHDRRDFSHS